MTAAGRRREQLALSRALRDGVFLRIRTVTEPSSVVVNLFCLDADRALLQRFVTALVNMGFREQSCEIAPPPGAVALQLECVTRERFQLAQAVRELRLDGVDKVEPPPVPWVAR